MQKKNSQVKLNKLLSSILYFKNARWSDYKTNWIKLKKLEGAIRHHNGDSTEVILAKNELYITLLDHLFLILGFNQDLGFNKGLGSIFVRIKTVLDERSFKVSWETRTPNIFNLFKHLSPSLNNPSYHYDSLVVRIIWDVVNNATPMGNAKLFEMIKTRYWIIIKENLSHVTSPGSTLILVCDEYKNIVIDSYSKSIKGPLDLLTLENTLQRKQMAIILTLKGGISQDLIRFALEEVC